MYVSNTVKLTDAAVLGMLSAAVEEAKALCQPQCIVIVDASGVTLGQFRMVGAKCLSLKSAMSKARTAASIGVGSDAVPQQMALAIAAATDGDMTGLAGGVPVSFDGVLAGIGVGSGSPEQDRQVAEAALRAIGADL